MGIVLLIDDAPGMGNLVEMSLGSQEIQVIQVVDLDGALEAARHEKPLAVLLDIALGQEDGLKLLPDLKTNTAFLDVPVIVFTVHPSKEAAALTAGADGFLKKPFRREDLLRVLGTYLGDRD